ncbi:tripartite tricarboxylate transporter substrate binding protein [Alteribacillus sp. HJP-4]|uniref:tripartite tricarboxylate transporter substrate binding protein n=1 Tax=Alteribacillus sp. HJP-4 TaxID=2775394 RepID=UPI0035CCF530
MSKWMSKKTGSIFMISTMTVMLAACGSEESSGSSEGEGSKYPEDSIEVVVPAGAGGDTDRNTRTLANYMEEELGVSLVIQNVEGSGGSTGTSEVLDSDPDGYRVVAYHDAMLLNNILGLTDYSYSDFELAGISILDQSNTFMVSAEAEYDNAEEMIEYAKKNPGDVNVATETGAFTHLQLLAIQQETGAEFNIVDAGGASDKITALLGGQVDVVPTSLGLVEEYVESGEMKSLGILAEERLEQFPDVPTFQEQGIDVTFDKTFMWAFPPETPEEVVNTFSEAMETVVTDNEEFREEISSYAVQPEYMNPDEAEKLLDETNEYYTELNESTE